MKDLSDQISNFIHGFTFGWVDLVDILLVAFIIYKILMLIRGTRALRFVIGAFFFIVLLGVSNKLKLTALNWLLERAAVLLPVALVILLMPELRQLIEGMTRLQLLGFSTEDNTEVRTIEEIVAAVSELASGRVGALIVIERNEKLDEIASTGVLLNARVSAPLLCSIFYEGNPLHDGAVIIRGDTILAAACRLPLSESRRVDRAVHMRHRAALGVSETSDCIAIVVSEERGTISSTIADSLLKLGGHNELRDLLNREVRGEETRTRAKPLISIKPRAEAKR